MIVNLTTKSWFTYTMDRFKLVSYGEVTAQNDWYAEVLLSFGLPSRRTLQQKQCQCLHSQADRYWVRGLEGLPKACSGAHSLHQTQSRQRNWGGKEKESPSLWAIVLQQKSLI